MGFVVCGGNESADSGVQGLSPESGDHAARDLAQCDAAGELDAVAGKPACSSAGSVDEPYDFTEPGVVALGGIDLEPGCLHRDPFEGVAPSREVRDVAIVPGVDVHPANRIVLAALQDPPEGHIGGDYAVHDPQARKIPQRRKAWPPHVILERGVGNGRDA